VNSHLAQATRSLGLAAVAVLAAVAPAQAELITGLTTTNGLVTFDSATPGTLGSVRAVTGLDAGDSLLAIDRNPNDGALYGLGRQSVGGATRMYRITNAGVATPVGPVFSTPPDTNDLDIDFDPSNPFGLLRIVTGSNQNLLWQASNGGSAVNTALDYPASDPRAAVDPYAVGLAFTNNFPGATTTDALVYDFQSPDALARLASGSGQLTTIGTTGVSAGAQADLGLDAAPGGTLYGLLRTNNLTRLYTLNPGTGAATLVGNVGDGSNTMRDIATDPVSNTFAFSATAFDASERDGKLTVTIKRNQAVGAGQVRLTSADGSATSNAFTDYLPVDLLVSFLPGELTKTVDVPLRRDVAVEPAETFTLTLSAPSGGVATLGAPASAVGQIQNGGDPLPSTVLTALTTTNGLVTFATGAVDAVSTPLAISGLAVGESLLGLDRRPANGRLYAISDQSRLYLLDEQTGAATAIGAPFSPPLTGLAFGFDFSPSADRARIVFRQNGKSMRVNPDTGEVIADADLVFAAGDKFAGVVGSPVALAYANNVPGATSTTPYGYDYVKDTWFRLGSEGGSPISPNTGAIFSFGPKTFTSQSPVDTGLDIDPDGTPWALIRDNAVTRLDILDLATGVPILVGTVGDGSDTIRDIAAPAVTNTLALGATAVTAGEAAGTAALIVTRSQALGQASLSYATADGTAVAGADYTATTGVLTFAAGETSKVLTIPVTDDAGAEGPETFSVAFSNPAGGVATLAGPATATVTIADNDSPPVVVNPDKTKPVLTFCGKAAQKLAKQKAVLVCLRSNEAGEATVSGKLKIAKKSFALKAVKRPVAARTGVTFKLPLAKATLKKLKSARGKATIAVTATVRDKAGNAGTLAKTITGKK